jgi:hypothetical protein
VPGPYGVSTLTGHFSQFISMPICGPTLFAQELAHAVDHLVCGGLSVGHDCGFRKKYVAVSHGQGTPHTTQ